jgi:predicted GIY-YIG superfamily endonuclease
VQRSHALRWQTFPRRPQAHIPRNVVRNAIASERHLKPWRREKKVFLIERANPTWRDLSADFPH